MTLNEIVVASLRRLDRGTDTQTIGSYRQLFATYANKAIKRIAKEFKQCKKESIVLDSDHMFDVNSLTHGCFQIESVIADGKPVDYWQDPPGSGLFAVATDKDTVSVVYWFVPNELKATSDVPEIPEYMHDIVPYYVAACEKAGGDPETYETSSIDYQIFNEQIASLVQSSRGEPRSHKLLNFW